MDHQFVRRTPNIRNLPNSKQLPDQFREGDEVATVLNFRKATKAWNQIRLKFEA